MAPRAQWSVCPASVTQTLTFTPCATIAGSISYCPEVSQYGSTTTTLVYGTPCLDVATVVVPTTIQGRQLQRVTLDHPHLHLQQSLSRRRTNQRLPRPRLKHARPALQTLRAGHILHTGRVTTHRARSVRISQGFKAWGAALTMFSATTSSMGRPYIRLTRIPSINTKKVVKLSVETNEVKERPTIAS